MMKKFKPNVTITLLYLLILMMISIVPMIFLLVLALKPNEWSEAFIIFPMLFIYSIFIIVILGLFNLFINLFLKVKVELADDCIIYKGLKILYNDVTRIAFDTGNIKSEPCSISFFNNNILLCSIRRPPFLMTILIKKKCKNAYFEIYIKKDILIMLLIPTGMGIIIALSILFQK